MLVTVARYQAVTGDSTSATAAVSGALVDAQALLEEKLDRELASAERLERMYPDINGRVYPRVTPITVAPPGLLVDGDILYSTGPFRAVPEFIFEGNWADLTYTGGYVERTANPSASNRLPEHVERDLCWAAYRLLHRDTSTASRLAGVTSARVGDAAVTFKDGSTVGTDADVGAVWSERTLRMSRVGRRQP